MAKFDVRTGDTKKVRIVTFDPETFEEVKVFGRNTLLFEDGTRKEGFKTDGYTTDNSDTGFYYYKLSVTDETIPQTTPFAMLEWTNVNGVQDIVIPFRIENKTYYFKIPKKSSGTISFRVKNVHATKLLSDVSNTWYGGNSARALKFKSGLENINPMIVLDQNVAPIFNGDYWYWFKTNKGYKFSKAECYSVYTSDGVVSQTLGSDRVKLYDDDTSLAIKIDGTSNALRWFIDVQAISDGTPVDPIVDKSILETTINHFTTYQPPENYRFVKSEVLRQAALDSANNVFNDVNSTQIEVDNAITELENEFAIEPIPVDPVDPPVDGNIVQFANIYKPTPSELQQVSELYFYTFNGGTIQEYDNSRFVTNLYKYPLKISEDMVKTKIILGKATSLIESDTFVYDTVTYDLGNIKIPNKYNNAYDFIETTINLRLPFINIITLPVEYCINQTIRIEFITDLYNGVTTLNIYSTFNNNIIYSSNINITQKIPLMNNVKNDVLVNKIGENKLLNNVKIPFIEVIRKKPININNKFGRNTFEYGRLGDFENYVVCDKIDLKVDTVLNEINEIENILKTGVYINKD